MMVSDGLCFTTDLLSPFEQAREIDACKIPTITDETLSFPELVFIGVCICSNGVDFKKILDFLDFVRSNLSE